MIQGYNQYISNYESDSLSLKRYLKQIQSFPYLSEEEEIILLNKLINNKCIESARTLLLSHMKLVVKIAFSYKSYGLSMIDMISEGSIGLMKAIKNFDLKMGCRLSTYAIWSIKAQIQEFILKSWSFLKINSRSLREKLFSSAKFSKRKIKSLEICNKENRDFINCKHIISLDQTYNDGFSESSYSITDILEDKDTLSPDKQYEISEANQIQKEILYESIKLLSDREKFIIYNRILSDKTKTLLEISAKLKISTERVRQIESAALKKMKKIFIDLYKTKVDNYANLN